MRTSDISISSIGGPRPALRQTYRLRRGGASTISIPSKEGGGIVVDVKYRRRKPPFGSFASPAGSYSSSQMALAPDSVLYDDMRYMPNAMFYGDSTDSYSDMLSSCSLDDSYFGGAYSTYPPADLLYPQGEVPMGGATFPPQIPMQELGDGSGMPTLSPTVQVHMQPPAGAYIYGRSNLQIQGATVRSGTASYRCTAATVSTDIVTATVSWRPAGQIPTSLSANNTPNWRIIHGHATIRGAKRRRSSNNPPSSAD
ncbi:hypothetical protein MTO96_009276 [Rhipicephalus appendiculatus]